MKDLPALAIGPNSLLAAAFVYGVSLDLREPRS
jgi:hypothetical protein